MSALPRALSVLLPPVSVSSPSKLHLLLLPSNVAAVNMSGAEAEETQSVVEDGGQGPGAPTPLSVLEVSIYTVQ